MLQLTVTTPFFRPVPFILSPLHCITFKLPPAEQGHNENSAVMRQHKTICRGFSETEGAFFCQRTFLFENNSSYFTGGWIVFSMQIS